MMHLCDTGSLSESYKDFITKLAKVVDVTVDGYGSEEVCVIFCSVFNSYEKPQTVLYKLFFLIRTYIICMAVTICILYQSV